jgi:phosphate/sulfate permease
MGIALVVLVVVVVTALAFDFTNGFHDTANAVATTIATGALRPRTAVLLAGVLNMVGAFLSVQVSQDDLQRVGGRNQITPTVIFAGLVGAILWNLLTWLLGLPSSSSHALIGGLIGATLVAAGADAVKFAGIVGKVLPPAVLSPVVAGLPARSGRVLVHGGARARHQRRAEDDGRHHAGVDHGGRAAAERRAAVVAHGGPGRGDGLPGRGLCDRALRLLPVDLLTVPGAHAAPRVSPRRSTAARKPAR